MDGMMIVLRSAKTLPLLSAAEITDQPCVEIGDASSGMPERVLADFYAGLVGDFRSTQKWKRLRRTKHDHHPVHDALGNAEALIRLLNGER